MNRDQLEELAALHALGLLEGEDRQAFERELAANPAARAIVAGLNHAASSLALTAEPATPPAALRERVLAALPDRDRTTHASPSTTHAAQRDNVVPFRWLPWAVAACLAVTAGFLFTRNQTLEQQLTSVETDRENARRELAAIIIERQGLQDRVAALEQGRILDRLQIATLQTQGSTNPEAAAVAAWDPETQQGLLKVVNLPPPGPDRDYQLWVVDPQQPDVPVSGGVFTTASTGESRFVFKPAQAVSAVAAFAVSDAPKGGEPKATGPIVLLGQ